MLFAEHARRCFAALRRLFEAIEGPMCLTLGQILLLLGTISFYDVIAPSLSYPFISIPICLLVTLNLYMHYYYAVTISPGFLDDPPRDSGNSFLWARKPNLDKTMSRGASWSEKGVKITPASTAQCQNCEKLRPERTHHCSRCNKCVIKYDHHCPVRVNQCVGLHNERHFVLLMIYIVISTLTMIISGFQHFIHALIHSYGMSYGKWEPNISEKWFVRAYLSIVVFFALVALILSSTLHGIIYGETCGESQVNEEYRRRAKKCNEEFINSYDCGKWKNLLFFFNIEEGGYSILTLFLPLRLDPYTDGYSWARKDGCESYPSFREAKPRETMMTKLFNFFHFN